KKRKRRKKKSKARLSESEADPSSISEPTPDQHVDSADEISEPLLDDEINPIDVRQEVNCPEELPICDRGVVVEATVDQSLDQENGLDKEPQVDQLSAVTEPIPHHELFYDEVSEPVSD